VEGPFSNSLLKAGEPGNTVPMEWERRVDLSVILEEKEGALAHLLRTARQAGVDPTGICGFLWGSYPLVHVLVGDPEKREIFESAGFDVRAESEVLVLRGEGQMELLSRASKLLTDSGIRLDICYLTADGGVAIGVDDFHRAQAVMDLWSQI